MRTVYRTFTQLGLGGSISNLTDCSVRFGDLHKGFEAFSDLNGFLQSNEERLNGYNSNQC